MRYGKRYRGAAYAITCSALVALLVWGLVGCAFWGGPREEVEPGTAPGDIAWPASPVNPDEPAPANEDGTPMTPAQEVAYRGRKMAEYLPAPARDVALGIAGMIGIIGTGVQTFRRKQQETARKAEERKADEHLKEYWAARDRAETVQSAAEALIDGINEAKKTIPPDVMQKVLDVLKVTQEQTRTAGTIEALRKGAKVPTQ